MDLTELHDFTPEQFAHVCKVMCMRLARDPYKSTPPTAPQSLRLVPPDLAVGGNTIEASPC